MKQMSVSPRMLIGIMKNGLEGCGRVLSTVMIIPTASRNMTPMLINMNCWNRTKYRPDFRLILRGLAGPVSLIISRSFGIAVF